jgi:hypothetical protein
VSGGYVATAAQLPLGTAVCVHIELASPACRTERWRITACVVRIDGRGLGLEWRHFAPRLIRQLLTSDASAAAALEAQRPSSTVTLREAAGSADSLKAS